MFFFRFYRAKLVCIALKGHCHNLSVIASSCHKLWLIASQPLFLSIHSVVQNGYNCWEVHGSEATTDLLWHLLDLTYQQMFKGQHDLKCDFPLQLIETDIHRTKKKKHHWWSFWTNDFFIWTWHSTDYIKCFFFFIFFILSLSPYLFVCLFDNFVFDHPSDRISEWKWFNNNCNVQSKCYLCIQLVFRRFLLST